MALPRCDTWPHAVKTPIRGILLAGWGAWLLVVGIRAWEASAGIDRMMNLVFVVGGPLVIVVGLALALRRGRSGA